jgi:hypothetical protein
MATYQSPLDLSSLKQYVQGTSGMLQADSTVLMQVSHNHLKARFPEIRLDLHVSAKGAASCWGRSGGRATHVAGPAPMRRCRSRA